METMQLQPVRTNIYPLILNVNHSESSDFISISGAETTKGASGVGVRVKSKLPFIEANTREVNVEHLKNDCVVPVFSKDNEITISHPSFIETAWEAAHQVFRNEDIEKPSIRVSHVVKGRTPEAIHKPVKDLLDEDKTIYYERMMFCFEIPSIHEDIGGNRLNLTIWG